MAWQVGKCEMYILASSCCKTGGKDKCYNTLA